MTGILRTMLKFLSYDLDDDSRDGLDPIALINQLIEQQPGVKLVKDLEPEALYIYGKVLTVERKKKSFVLHVLLVLVLCMILQWLSFNRKLLNFLSLQFLYLINNYSF